MGSKRRKRVAQSGGLLCHYCGFQTWVTPNQRAAVELTFPQKVAPGRHRKRALAARMFTVDHVHPQGNGGSNHPSNTVPACFLCNNMKGDAPEDQFRALIAYMKRLEVHPHQLFQRTGIWFQAEHIQVNQIRKATP